MDAETHTEKAMTEEEYRAHPAVNWSTLKNMGESPAHYRHAKDHDRPDTDTFALGRALHCLILEPMRFPELFDIWGEEMGKRMGKAWESFQAAATRNGQAVLREKDVANIRLVADAVRRNEDFQTLIATNDTFATEHAIVWHDGEFDRDMKARLDYLAWGTRPILIDLKTAQTTKAAQFGSQAARLGYVGQLAHYRIGAASKLGIAPTDIDCFVVAVEKAAPYDVAVFHVLPEDIAVGETDRARYLTRLAECEAAKTWPGRYAGIAPLRLPAWYYSDDAAKPEDYDGEDLDESIDG